MSMIERFFALVIAFSFVGLGWFVFSHWHGWTAFCIVGLLARIDSYFGNAGLNGRWKKDDSARGVTA